MKIFISNFKIHIHVNDVRVERQRQYTTRCFYLINTVVVLCLLLYMYSISVTAWPLIPKPLKIIQTQKNKLSNRSVTTVTQYTFSLELLAYITNICIAQPYKTSWEPGCVKSCNIPCLFVQVLSIPWNPDGVYTCHWWRHHNVNVRRTRIWIPGILSSFEFVCLVVAIDCGFCSNFIYSLFFDCLSKNCWLGSCIAGF